MSNVTKATFAMIRWALSLHPLFLYGINVPGPGGILSIFLMAFYVNRKKNSIITRLDRKHECILHVSNVAGVPANPGGKGDQKLAFNRILMI